MKVLSAFRAKRDFCCLKEGEVFNLSLFTDICDLDTSISRKVLYELYCASLGEETAFELNYADAPADSGRSSYGKADGVIWLDMMKSDSPQLIINGPITRKSARWCEELTEVVNKNDRLGMSFMFGKKFPEEACLVIFVNEPTAGCIKNIPFVRRCVQVISATTDMDRYIWDNGHHIVPNLHAVVSRLFIIRVRDASKLSRPLSGKLNGYVLKMTVTGDSPFLYDFGVGTWDFYRCIGGCWVSEPGSAFIYSSEKEAARAKVDTGTSSQALYRIKAGARLDYLRLNLNQAITSTVISTQQWRNEMFGPSDGINYYAEACKEDF